MNIEPITVRDKLERTIVLRAAIPEDAKELIRYLKVTSGETPYLIREPEEIELTLEQEESFIKDRLESKSDLMLVALLDGKHIGNCSLMSLAPYKRYKHRCDIAIALYKEYCGCGIGKLMMETVLKAATEIGYEQAELEVVSSNKAAISLYEKLGFKKYGTFPDSMKYSDGTYMDSDWMMKKL
ncbi:MAG: GNAT family N-acetyltransferase [Lachnospiraceae bacterium]|nr:GNAT family N-acetyltransferase [Lachnospiraceae bacterium]